MVFVLVATGVVVKYLRRYQINYMYIFELDPTYKITQSQLFKVTLLHLKRSIDVNSTPRGVGPLFALSNICGEARFSLRENRRGVHLRPSAILHIPLRTALQVLL